MHNIPEHLRPQEHHCRNLKSCTNNQLLGLKLNCPVLSFVLNTMNKKYVPCKINFTYLNTTQFHPTSTQEFEAGKHNTRSPTPFCKRSKLPSVTENWVLLHNPTVKAYISATEKSISLQLKVTMTTHKLVTVNL